MQADKVSDTAEQPAGHRLRVDDLLVNLERRTVTRGAQVIDLPDLSFRLLAALICHAPTHVDKDELIREVWGDTVVSDETLAQRVRLLRQALGEDSQHPRYIAVVRGRGYRLLPAVTRAQQPHRKKVLHSYLPLAAIAALIVAALFWHSGRNDVTVAPLPARDAIAVLPFKDMSANGDNQFFADGMQEELLRRLAAIPGLAVISRTSVEPYRDNTISLPELSTRLGAAIIIEGSVRIDDENLRITVQLIDAARDEHLWADSYDRELSMQSIFSIQQDVADRVAQVLEVGYASERTHNTELPTHSLAAYNQYLLGRYHTFRQTPEDLEQAVRRLENAVAIDPQFAEAYATLGWTYSFLGTGYGGRPPKDVYPLAKEAALRAIALDSGLADARTLYADILTWFDWDFVAAEQEYLRTLEIDPLNVLGFALFLSTQERHDEAIELVERRLAANPHDPYVHINAGWRYFDAGRYDEAIAAAENGMQHADGPALLGWSQLAKGNAAAAIAAFTTAIESGRRGARQVANLATAHYRAGNDVEAGALLLELQALARGRYVSPALFAAVHFSAGDADQGFAMLDEALEQRSREMIFLRVNTVLDGYRDDPRYEQLLEKVGFR